MKPEPSDNPRRVVLVGMMGSGKTTVGRLLADATGWPYRDNDELVCELTGMTSGEILASAGEAGLREAESRALAAGLVTPAPAVIGAAGGTILDENDRQRIRDTGTVVWLRGSARTLHERAAGAAHRPWVRQGGEAWFDKAVAERDPLYASVADVTLDADDRPAREIADELLARLSLGQ